MKKPNPTKGQHIIFWTDREKREVAQEVNKMQLNGETDTLLRLVRIAQKVLPPERQRNLRTMNDVPWLKQFMYTTKVVTTIELTSQDEELIDTINDKVTLTVKDISSEELISELSKRILQPLFDNFSSTIEKIVASQLERINIQVPQYEVTRNVSIPLVKKTIVEKPVVLIAGLLHDQENIINKDFGDTFNLKFWNKDMSSHKLGDMTKMSDYAIVFTSHIAHQHENKIRGNLGSDTRFIRHSGGMTNLKNLLQSMKSKI